MLPKKMLNSGRIALTALGLSLLNTLAPLPVAAAGPAAALPEVVTLEHVKEGVEIVSGVVKAVNRARSAVITVENETPDAHLTVQSWKHYHVGFATTPHRTIPPQHADIFGSHKKGGALMTGTEGKIIYQAEGKDLALTIWWTNPYIGSNKCRASVQGDASYEATCIAGSGEKDAQMRFVLYKK